LISPHRWVFYILAGFFAVLGFYFNVIRERKWVNVIVYSLSMCVLLTLFIFA